jgi:acetyl esterase
LADNPHASPAAGAVSPDTPKATIVVAGNDPLHDEGASYAEKLRAAGVPVTLLSYPGAIHGFASMIGMVPLADEAVAAGAAALRDSFGE